MVLLAAFCSLPTGELAGLRRSSVDLLHRTIGASGSMADMLPAGTAASGPASG